MSSLKNQSVVSLRDLQFTTALAKRLKIDIVLSNSILATHLTFAGQMQSLLVCEHSAKRACLKLDCYKKIQDAIKGKTQSRFLLLLEICDDTDLDLVSTLVDLLFEDLAGIIIYGDFHRDRTSANMIKLFRGLRNPLAYEINPIPERDYEHFLGFFEGGRFGFANNDPKPGFKVLSILTTFNEADIIVDSVQHSLDLGFMVHVVDNWSTDGSWDLLQEAYSDNADVVLERFPEEPINAFDLSSLLLKTQEIAAHSHCDWIIRLDADERLSSISEMSIYELLQKADTQGFDYFDFTVLEFRPSDANVNSGSSLPTHWFFASFESHRNIQRAWRNDERQIEIASSGGHSITGKIHCYPLNLILRHYSFRSSTQAKDKVFRLRLPRYSKKERSGGWHHQYDGYKVDDSFLWDSRFLNQWGLNVKNQLMLEVTMRVGNFPGGQPRMLDLPLNPSGIPVLKHQKTVLLMLQDFFGPDLSGGPLVYRMIVEACPEILFYSFTTGKNKTFPKPKNLVEITLTPGLQFRDPTETMLACVSGRNFDVIDIPDWLAPSRAVSAIARKYDVSYSKLVVALHGSNSRVFETRPTDPLNKSRVNYLHKRESRLYRDAAITYGLSEVYAQSLGLHDSFCELDPLSFVQNFIQSSKNIGPECRQTESGFSMNFSGRKEYTKGYDLFLNLVKEKNISKTVKIYASPAYDFDEYRSLLRLEHETRIDFSVNRKVSRNELVKLYRDPTAIWFFPSRFDSFNLGLLECLIMGGAAVVSPGVLGLEYCRKMGFDFISVDDFINQHPSVDSISKLRESNLKIIRALEVDSKRLSREIGGVYGV